jgi:ligand-binding sensor domain-containing protein
MKQYFIKKSTYSLFFAFIYFASCKGQSTEQIKSSEAKSIQISFPKLVKTQHSNQADNVHCGLEDKNGNIWFGTTRDGVYRYDGKSFTNFTSKDGLNSNVVWSILEDKQGNIWFGTDAGICRFDGKSIKSIPITTGSYLLFNSTNTKNAVWSILQDRNGTIWFGTDEGLYCFNGKAFTKFLDDPKIINKSRITLKSIQCMYEDHKGNIWFGSGPMAFEGICQLSGHILTNFKPNNETWIRSISENKKGDILFVTRHVGLVSYDGNVFTAIYKPEKLKADEMNAGLVDRNENVWFTSDYVNDNDFSVGGVWRYDGKTFIEYPKRAGLNNTSIMYMLEDRNGNIWFGTRNTGLYRFDGKNFTSFSE